MSDGWTGLNIEAVKKELDDFEQKMYEIASNYQSAYDLFEDELKKLWASPRAVDFNTNLLHLERYGRKIKYDCDDVLRSASNAAKIMAQHNGATFDYDYHGYKTIGEREAETGQKINVGYVTWDESFGPLKQSINGVEGMNIPLVKYSLDCFQGSAQAVINDLNALPINFSLIDPNGELVSLYRSIVTKRASELQEEINDAVATVSAALEEETLQVRLGKEQAEQTLSA